MTTLSALHCCCNKYNVHCTMLSVLHCNAISAQHHADRVQCNTTCAPSCNQCNEYNATQLALQSVQCADCEHGESFAVFSLFARDWENNSVSIIVDLELTAFQLNQLFLSSRIQMQRGMCPSVTALIYPSYISQLYIPANISQL